MKVERVETEDDHKELHHEIERRGAEADLLLVVLDEHAEALQVEQLDADLSGFAALCSSLSSSQIVSISLRKCYLGPQALALLTDAIKVMAALTEVDVRRNMLDEAVLEQLRAAAPETCKILAD